MGCRSIIFMTVLVVFQSFSSLYAQPTAFTHSVQTLEYTDVIVPEPVDLQAVLEEDKQRESQVGPYPFAVPRAVHITPETNGLWEQIDHETLLWRLPIASPEALSLSLGFTRYVMPSGGRMYLYSIDENQVIGPFSDKDNKEHGQLWTPIINSEAIVLELTIPSSKVPDLELQLSYINHGYRGVNSISPFGIGDSDWCQRNVACPEGNDWRDQIRSVAKYNILFDHGPDYLRLGYCTGALINNTAQDDKPYFLTAFHCLDADQDLLLDEVEQEKTKTMVIYWNFQAEECGGSDDDDTQYQSGADFRAGYWKSDFALVELEDMPPSAADVYYAGWDLRSTTPSGGVAIHHPKQDLKKISIENDPLHLLPTLVNHGDENNPIVVDHGDCFQVHGWDVGITEKGSSGCPLFDLNSKRILGQSLSGACTCDTLCVSAFGPLYKSWSEGGSRDTRLSDWLDPTDTGVMFLDGKDHEHQACDIITTGTGYTPLIYPIATEYQDTRTQVIYLATEINTKGLIKRLALDITTSPGQRMNNWTIRMKHTSKSQYSTCTFEAAGWTVVYQSDESITSTGWRWFEFQTPFEFNGTDNLMVDFCFNNSSTSSHGECRWSGTAGKRSVLAFANSEYGDPLDWTFTMQDCLEGIPNVKLNICSSLEFKINDAYGKTGDKFGQSVSISGNYAIVGAPYRDECGTDSGAAYIYVRSGNGWRHQDRLFGDQGDDPTADSGAGDQFGYSVSISGDYAIVGARWDDNPIEVEIGDDRTNCGSAYIFKRQGIDWVQQGHKLMGGAYRGEFGYAVAIDGNYVIIGAPHDDESGTDRGAASIYMRSGNDWRYQDKLIASDGSKGDFFGCSVAISGDYAIVGAYKDDDPRSDYGPVDFGSAYVFKRQGSKWREQEKLIALDGSSIDLFGYSVSISGAYAIIGAYGNRDSRHGEPQHPYPEGPGSAYIFKRGVNSWTQQDKIIALDGSRSSRFGYSVSIDGDRAIVGATSGSAHIFERNESKWEPQSKLTASDAESGARFGNSVSMNGNHVIIGAYQDDDNGVDSGSAYLFQLP